MPREVAIIDTGVANNASVRALFERLGLHARLTRDVEDAIEADALVLPGVGVFGAGMGLLDECGLREPIRERVAQGRPTLCVCLGLQMLFEQSEESPGVTGLGVCAGGVTEFPNSVVRPQFGWNVVAAGAADDGGYAYFANTYRVTQAPEGWDVSWSEHGGRFVAAMRRGGVLACQFHPELSGAYGAKLVDSWLRTAEVGTPC